MKTVYKVFAILMIAVSMFVIMPNNMCFADATNAISKVENEAKSDNATTAGISNRKTIRIFTSSIRNCCSLNDSYCRI